MGPERDSVQFASIGASGASIKYLNIIKDVKTFLSQTGIVYPGRAKLEISHHYGIENFYKTGITMIPVINREYCKKYIIALPGQSHPEQYHKIKEETF